jgi:uncharacterized protein DUF1569
MKTFWDSSARDEICRRMEGLTFDAKPQWGTFNATEMLAHMNDAMRMAMGELPVAPKKLPIRYSPLKQLIIYVLPFPKGAPTAPELIARGSSADFANEKAEFRRVADRLGTRPASAAWPEHPAFGVLTYRAWGVLGYRHADHHLRQFGL